jgi:hypothetical protein
MQVDALDGVGLASLEAIAAISLLLEAIVTTQEEMESMLKHIYVQERQAA